MFRSRAAAASRAANPQAVDRGRFSPAHLRQGRGVDVEADVEHAHAVRERAARDQVDAGFCRSANQRVVPKAFGAKGPRVLASGGLPY